MAGNAERNLRIAILARAPVAGAAKTRLIPILGPEGAARLQGRLIRRTVERSAAVRPARLELWCTPDTSHPIFARMRAEHGVRLRQQRGTGLGERLSHAARGDRGDAAPVLLVGTDWPALCAERLLEAAAVLASGSDAVVVPARDGGYVLLGLRRHAPGLFRAVDWGTERVYGQTVARLDELGWRWRALATARDLDLPADYRDAIRSHPELDVDAGGDD